MSVSLLKEACSEEKLLLIEGGPGSSSVCGLVSQEWCLSGGVGAVPCALFCGVGGKTRVGMTGRWLFEATWLCEYGLGARRVRLPELFRLSPSDFVVSCGSMGDPEISSSTVPKGLVGMAELVSEVGSKAIGPNWLWFLVFSELMGRGERSLEICFATWQRYRKTN